MFFIATLIVKSLNYDINPCKTFINMGTYENCSKNPCVPRNAQSNDLSSIVLMSMNSHQRYELYFNLFTLPFYIF